MDKQFYIYKTTNLINKKQYIGKHIGKINDFYLGNGINIKAAIKKYGKELTNDHKQKISKSLKEYWTEERRKERAEKYSGKNNPMYGKHHTKESKAKRIANTDFSVYRTEEYRKKCQ